VYKAGENGIISPSKIPVKNGDHAPSLRTVHCSRLYNNTFSLSRRISGRTVRQTVALIELTGLAGVEKFMPPFKGDPIGRPRHKRQPIVVVFPAKAVWNDSTIRALLDRLSADSKLRPLCGWETELDLPGEASGTRSLPGGRKVAILSEKRTMRCL
jgi:hypothetical protein